MGVVWKRERPTRLRLAIPTLHETGEALTAVSKKELDEKIAEWKLSERDGHNANRPLGEEAIAHEEKALINL